MVYCCGVAYYDGWILVVSTDIFIKIYVEWQNQVFSATEKVSVSPKWLLKCGNETTYNCF